MDIPPPNNGSPYPKDAEPLQEEIEFVEVEYKTGSNRAVHPVVVAIGLGVAGNMVYDGGKYVITKAWEVATKAPVNDFSRPATIYSSQTGQVYRREGNGYVPVGPAQMQ